MNHFAILSAFLVLVLLVSWGYFFQFMKAHKGLVEAYSMLSDSYTKAVEQSNQYAEGYRSFRYLYEHSR